MLDNYVAHRRRTATQIDAVYAFDKQGAFEKAGTPESRAFITERTAAGASELCDLIYTARIESANPVPDRY